MNFRRVVLGCAGVVAVSLAMVATGYVGGLLPSESVVSVLGNDYVFVAAIALAILAVAAVVLERGDEVVQTRMPDPETATAVPAPGDELAEALDGWRMVVPFAGAARKRELRERLRDDAVVSVRRVHNCDEATARERVAAGTWTDDGRAATFLGDELRIPSVSAVLQATLRGEAPFVHGARRTATAVADLERDRLGRASPDDATSTDTDVSAPGGTGSPDGTGDATGDRPNSPRTSEEQREGSRARRVQREQARGRPADDGTAGDRTRRDESEVTR